MGQLSSPLPSCARPQTWGLRPNMSSARRASVGPQEPPGLASTGGESRGVFYGKLRPVQGGGSWTWWQLPVPARASPS